MTIYTWRDSAVPADHPYPALSPCQKMAFSSIVSVLRSNPVSWQALPAAAGSGKTRVLVSLVNAMLAMGAKPASVHAISFTNKSANEFRSRVIMSHHQGGEMLPGGPQNIEFQTIHSHALAMLCRLQPHVPGVAYYFDEGQDTLDKEDEETAEMQRSLKLAYFSSLVHRDGGQAMHAALSPFLEDEQLFPARDLVSGPDVCARAARFIDFDLMSSAGLGAFTNVDDGGIGYPMAVCTDALLRLSNEKRLSVAQKREMLGLPELVLVDEVQDTDVLQMLYFRALMMNGCSFVSVGDRKQTLYRWRQSVGLLAFHDGFLRAMAPAGAFVRVATDTPLLENRRSRGIIVNFAEDFFENLEDAAAKGTGAGDFNHFRPIRNQGVASLRSIAVNDPGCALSSVSVLLGESMKFDLLEDADAVVPKVAKPVRGALAKLRRAQESFLPEAHVTTRRKSRACQVSGLCGGSMSEAIAERLADMHDRAQLGETCAVIMRNGATPNDIRLLKRMVSLRRPTDARAGKVDIYMSSPEKSSCLAACTVIPTDSSSEAVHAVPLSNVMVAAAVHFFLHGWDKDSGGQLKAARLRPLSYVPSAPPGPEFSAMAEKEAAATRVRMHLWTFQEAMCHRYGCDSFPADLTERLVEYVLSVIEEYVRLVRKAYSRKAGSSLFLVPCRFDSCSREGKHPEARLRKAGDQKFYFKTFWSAVCNAKLPSYLGLDPALDELCKGRPELQMVADWKGGSDSFLSLQETLAGYLDVEASEGSALHANRDVLLRAREDTYKQFARLWHRKVRRYMRTVFAKVGEHNRKGNDNFREVLRKVSDEAYAEACRDAGLSTGVWRDVHGKMQVAGLFEGFCSSPKEMVLRRVDQRKARDGSIEVTTIHSSKGLEWDHVMFLFPRASGMDARTSDAESYQNLYYVAMTRACRTLTVLVDAKAAPEREPSNKEVLKASNTANRVLAPVLRGMAERGGFIGASLDWDDPKVADDTGKHDSIEVRQETSHSEAEDAMTCRIRHDIKYRREPPSMVSLSSPGYSFFFHGIMSSVVAHMAGQRVLTDDDEISVISRTMEQAVTMGMDDEDDIREHVMRHAEEALYTTIEAMVPAHLIERVPENPRDDEDSKYEKLMDFYCKTLSAHLAAICKGSSLFREVLRARKSGAFVRVEKPLRTIMIHADDRLPFVGVPDLRIESPDKVHVFDYKSVPPPDDKESDEDYERRLSRKTAFQVNLYQGMLGGSALKHHAEIIYVRDVTVQEKDEVPSCLSSIPSLRGNFGFRAVEQQEHARILASDSFNEDMFAEAGKVLSDLRVETENRVPCDMRWWRPEPLIDEDGQVEDGLEVSAEQCRLCTVAAHCHKNLNLHDTEGNHAPVF